MMTKIQTAFLAMLLLSTYALGDDAFTRGEIIFKKCAGCHGSDGKNKAFGKSGVIAGQDAADLVESLTFYKESEFKGQGSTLVMAKQLKTFSAKDITDLALYISKLPK